MNPRMVFFKQNCSAAIVVCALGALAGIAPAEEPKPNLDAIPKDLRAKYLPRVPVIHVAAAAGGELTLDGKLDEPVWKNARAFTEWGRDDGQGVHGLPASLKLLRAGRQLWVGLYAGFPPGRDGKPVKDAIEGEGLELWIDNAFTRHTFYQLMLNPNGSLKVPGFSAQEAQKAAGFKVQIHDAGYSVEICLELDRFDGFGAPNPDFIGFNFARESLGSRWASVVGVIGISHKPHQFWTLNLTGKAQEALPESAYPEPFVAGTGLRGLAGEFVQAWQDRKNRIDGAHAMLTEVLALRLQKLLKDDEKDPWGFAGRLSAVLYRALGHVHATDWRVHLSAPASDFAAWVKKTQACLERAADNELYSPKTWHEEAFRSDADGSAQPFAVYLPPDYSPKKKYPLMVFLHGSGQTHFAEGVVYDRYDVRDPRYIKIQPLGRQCSGWHPIALRDVLDALNATCKRYSIDEDRVYLYGYSSGAFATLTLAAEQPHRFAAIASIAGGFNGGNEDNLRHLPVLIVHGLNDTAVNFEKWMALSTLTLAAGGTPLTEHLLPFTGHGTPLTGVEEWLLKWKRKAAPDTVVCKSSGDNPRPQRAYWAALLAQLQPHEPAAVSAEVRDGILTARTANTAACGFDLATLRQAGKRVQSLRVDGAAFEAPETDCVRFVRERGAWRLDAKSADLKPDAAAYSAGGLDNVYRNGPLLIIAPKDLEKLARNIAASVMGQPAPFVRIPIRWEDEVTDEDLQGNNLILIGGPQRNKISARIAEKTWLLPEAEGQIVILPRKDGQPIPKEAVKPGVNGFDPATHGFSVVTRNPFAPARRIWVLAIPADKGFKPNSPMNSSGYWRTGPDVTAVKMETGEIVGAWHLKEDWQPRPVPLTLWKSDW